MSYRKRKRTIEKGYNYNYFQISLKIIIFIFCLSIIFNNFYFKIYFYQENKINLKAILHKKSNPKNKNNIRIENNYTDLYLKSLNKTSDEYIEFNKFLELKDKPENENDQLIAKEKNEILLYYFNKTDIDHDLNIYFDNNIKFGNQFLALNKLIFFCEIMNCKKIIIPKNNDLFIKNDIYDAKYNLTIEVEKRYRSVYDKNFDKNVFPVGYNNLFFTLFNFKIENRMEVLRDEIIKNLPKVETNISDLYIHVRSSDVFKYKDSNYAPKYAQPPLCFYKKVIDTNKFENIYIIAEDNYNPIINKLTEEYNNTKYIKNSKEKHIAFLAYAYNVVGSISSFYVTAIKLNKNLINVYEYDIYPITIKIIHLHHILYKYKRNYNIYEMFPSEEYKEKMKIWEFSGQQIELMMKDNCTNDFILFKPNI